LANKICRDDNDNLTYGTEALLLGVQLCFRRFFPKFEALLYKTGYTFMIQSIVAGHYFFPSLGYESRVEKTGHLLRLSTNRPNFLLLHKTGSAGQPGRVPLIETSDRGSLENTAGGVGLPISTFPNMS